MKADRSASTWAGVLGCRRSSTQKSTTSLTAVLYRSRVSGVTITSCSGRARAAARRAAASAATRFTFTAAETPAGRRVGRHVVGVAVAVERVAGRRKQQGVEPPDAALEPPRAGPALGADRSDRLGIQ